MRVSIKTSISAIALSALVSAGSMGLVLAHEDEHHDRRCPHPAAGFHSGQPERPMPPAPSYDMRLAKSSMGQVSNPVYKEQCGSCHFAYQPELLPSGSWRKILGKLDDHFGEVLPLSPEMVDEITAYLQNNAAERSSAKRAVKIVDSLQGATPLRITEVPYIISKHRKISSDVLHRASIGSLSNCAACHRTAANGIYDDDSVSIPK